MTTAVRPRYLSQVLGIEKDTRRETQNLWTDIHRSLAVADLITGQERFYTPYADDGERHPSEDKRVQVTVREAVERVSGHLVSLFDITAARDFTNGSGTAKADVVVNGTVMIKDAPTPFLLWMENKLNDIHTFISKMPVHPSNAVWEEVEQRGVWRTAEAEVTIRREQSMRTIQLAPATAQHKEQAQLIPEDRGVGTWTVHKLTGAIPANQKATLLHRVRVLRDAVEVARGEANRVEAIQPDVGHAVIGYLFEGI